MTPLKKEVKRMVEMLRRKVVVTLKPDGFISFRDKGKHTEFEIGLEACYMLAAKRAAEELRQNSKRRQKEGLP